MFYCFRIVFLTLFISLYVHFYIFLLYKFLYTQSLFVELYVVYLLCACNVVYSIANFCLHLKTRIMIDVPFANGNIYVDKVLLKFAQQAKQLGYEPAGLTVHPPPPKKNDRGWVHFFRMGVYCLVSPKFFLKKM